MESSKPVADSSERTITMDPEGCLETKASGICAHGTYSCARNFQLSSESSPHCLTCPTTPTISTGGPEESQCIRLPIGSWLGKNLRAKTSSTTITCGECSLSWSVKN